MALKKNDSLVIVESPAKAKTINKILGKEFFVKASVGHIKDLPKKELGVDVDNGYKPKYTIIPGKEKVIDELKQAAQKASKIYLAPDPDREGEAIAWHISEIIGEDNDKIELYRVIFNEITERAVRKAIASPSKINTNKVNAQQARRVLDRLVGYGLSPLLWKKVRRGLSAGRVQSVVTRMIVDREREIENFKTQEYWTVDGLFLGSIEPKFNAKLYKFDGALLVGRSIKGNKFLLQTKTQADEVLEYLKDKHYALINIEKKLKKRSPSPPFITSTLQQEAYKKLRYSAKKTMSIAQKLYEGIELGEDGSVGLITYMRTDSTRIAEEAQKWAKELIIEKYGKDYAPEKPNKYKVKASAQEAHEAIRPTYKEYEPEIIKKFLTREQYSLYRLIWNRFIASQMAQALIEQTTFDISEEAKRALFRATGSIIKFKGFMALYIETLDDENKEPSDVNEDEAILPDLNKDDALNLLEIKNEQHFTQPPPRYTEASLVKALEDNGVGRPSTYATILSTIVDRNYIIKEDGKFQPSELGILVNDLLVERFPELIDSKFTAKMETDLDKIEEGAVIWTEVMDNFYPNFNKELSTAEKELERKKVQDKPTDLICDKCGSSMVIKWSKYGRFISCSDYPKCKNAKPLENSNGENNRPPETPTDLVCDKCGSAMVIKSGKYGRFYACSNYPNCKNVKPIPTGLKCPLDGADIIQRKTKKGIPFYGCSNYPDCTFVSWSKPVMEKCPDCGANFLIEKKNKQGETIICCQTKGCNYTRQEA
ncbi:DNA topoisomerase I [Candidatus Magnetoovum chiemensis]|nr:DNA topoisomerase I [Candidatus Magnetoovum chiemensis]